MKNILTSLILLCCLQLPVSAQWINSITYQPAVPSAADTITFYVELSFPSGTCDQHTQGYNVNGNTIDAFALHCLGMLTYICYHTDTFKINPLPAGAYTFRFQVDAGMLPFPCTPGIIPGPSDSISFTVNPVTGLQLTLPAQVSVLATANELIIETDQCEKCMIAIYDLNGKLIRREKISKRTERINLTGLGSGSYLYAVFSGDKIIREGSFAKP